MSAANPCAFHACRPLAKESPSRFRGAEVQARKGLNEGVEIILYPGDRITDGQRVSPVKI